MPASRQPVGPQRHGVQAHPGGHALAPVIHCSAGLRVSLGGQKAEEAHPDRKAVCQQYTVGGTLANYEQPPATVEECWSSWVPMPLDHTPSSFQRFKQIYVYILSPH